MGFMLYLQGDFHPCRGSLKSQCAVDGRLVGVISAMGEKRAEDTEQMSRPSFRFKDAHSRGGVSLSLDNHKTRLERVGGGGERVSTTVEFLTDHVAWKNIRHLKTERAQASVEIGSPRSTSSLLSIIILPFDRQYRHTRTAYVRETLSRCRALSHGAFTRFNPCRRLPIQQRPLVSAAIMAKDKSFHSAAIIVDATVDIADIVVSPGGDFWSSAKRLYLLIEQAPNRSDSGNFPSSANFNFKRIFTCCRITVRPLPPWKVICHREFWTSSLNAGTLVSLSYRCLWHWFRCTYPFPLRDPANVIPRRPALAFSASL